VSREKRLGRGLEALLGKVAAQAQVDAEQEGTGIRDQLLTSDLCFLLLPDLCSLTSAP
jgi:hypothetical protein